MKEEKQLNMLKNKLSKLMLRKSALQQKREEFKSKYGTRNAKLTATQLKAKESLKEKYKINNAKISELKKMMKMNRIVMGKGGSNGNGINFDISSTKTNTNSTNTNRTKIINTTKIQSNIENFKKENQGYKYMLNNQVKYAENFPSEITNNGYNRLKDIYKNIYINHIDPTIFLSTKFFLSFIYYFYDYFKQSNITDIDTFDRLKKTKEKDLNESVLNESVLNESVLNPIRYLFDRTHELHVNNIIYRHFAIENDIPYLACKHDKKKNSIYFIYFDNNKYYKFNINEFFKLQSGIMSINNLYDKNKKNNHAVYFHKMRDKQYVIYDPNARGVEIATFEDFKRFHDYFNNEKGLTFEYNLCTPAKLSLNSIFTRELRAILTSTICLIEDDECNNKDMERYDKNIKKWNDEGFCAYVSLFFSILSTNKNNSYTKTIVDIIKILNVSMSENVSNHIKEEFLKKASKTLSGIPSKEMFFKMKELVEFEVEKKKWLSFQLGENEELTLEKFNRFIKEYNIIHQNFITSKIDPNFKNVNFISSQNKNIYTEINNDKFFTSHIESFKRTYDCIYKRLLYINDYELLEECSLTDIRISEYQDFESFFNKHWKW